MADSHWRTRTRIPNAAIGDWDPSLDLCNVIIQHVTIVAKGKTLQIQVQVRIRVWQYETAIKDTSNPLPCPSIPHHTILVIWTTLEPWPPYLWVDDAPGAAGGADVGWFTILFCKSFINSSFSVFLAKQKSLTFDWNFTNSWVRSL